MTVKVSFVASDGREFDTETECIMYEVEINPEKFEGFHNGVIMLHYMNGLVLNGKKDEHPYEDITTFFSNTFAVIVFDEEKAEGFFKPIINAGTECPDSEPGIYFLDGFTNKWVRKVDESVDLMNTINQKYLKSI